MGATPGRSGWFKAIGHILEGVRRQRRSFHEGCRRKRVYYEKLTLAQGQLVESQ